MAALLSKIDLRARFTEVENEALRKALLRELRNTGRLVVNAEGDELAAMMTAPTTDSVADIVARRWIDREKAKLRSLTGVAKLFMHGRSQAVRLPKEFRFAGDRVRVRSEGNTVVLEPFGSDVDAWFAEIDRHVDVDFMADGRRQPPMPPDPIGFE